MAVITPFFDVVAGVAILAGRSSLLDTGIFKTANTNFTIRHLLALGFIGYGGWNLWKIERAQDKLKKSLGAEEEEKYLVTFEYTNGDMEEIDKVIFSKGDRYKYGDSEERNHAHLINSQFYMTQDEEEWEDEPDAIEYSLDRDYVGVEWGDGYARVRSIETISAEDVKVLAKLGFGAEDYTEIGICDYGLVCDHNIPTPLNEYGICQECQEQWEYENEMFPLEKGAERFNGEYRHKCQDENCQHGHCPACGNCDDILENDGDGFEDDENPFFCGICGVSISDVVSYNFLELDAESFGADGHYLRKSKYDDNGRWDIYWEGDSRYRNYAITLKDNPNDIRIVVEYSDDTGYSLAIPQPDTIKNFSTMNEVLEYLDNMGDGRIGVFTHRFSTNRSYPTVGDWGAESLEVKCENCQEVIGTEEEVYDEESVEWYNIDGEVYCPACKNEVISYEERFGAESFGAENCQHEWRKVNYGQHPKRFSHLWWCDKCDARIDSINMPSENRKVRPNSYTRNWKMPKQSYYFGAEPMLVQSDGMMVELMGFDGSYRSDGEVKVGYTTAAELGFEPKQLKPVMWVWDDIEGYGAFMATEDIRFV